MSTYFDAPASGTGNNTISISSKTLNTGTTVNSSTLQVTSSGKTVSASLSQLYRPRVSRTDSGEISGSGGTLSLSVNSPYPFYFRNNPSSVSSITYGNTDYKNVNPISSGTYAFNVAISQNSGLSARTETIEMAFQRQDGSYSYNSDDANLFKVSFTQASGGTAPSPSGETSGTSINVPIFFSYDGGDYIYVTLGQTVPFDVYTSVELSWRSGNQEMIQTTIPAGNINAVFSDFGGTPIDINIFDTSQLEYARITNLYVGGGAPEMTTTYGDDEYYLWWSEADCSTFISFLEGLGNDLDGVTWGEPPYVPTDYSKEYFTIEAISAGTLSWAASGLSYSKNDGAWTTWNSGSSLSLSPEDKVRFKSSVNRNYSGRTISSTNKYEAYGNTMSLFYGDNFSGQTSLSLSSCFRGLFIHQSNLVNVENLILPATAMTPNCYKDMFYLCSSIKKAPALPATSLNSGCYYGMFGNCWSLTSAPELPATTVRTECYEDMFMGCSALTTAPALPATTLGNSCYYNMFQGCISLTTAPELPATTLANYCYGRMFHNCSSLTTAPELPASTLTSYCYEYMFYGCSNLNYIKCLATYVSPSDAMTATRFWVDGVAANGTFVKDPNKTWDSGPNGIPTNWTVVDNT